MNCPPCTNRSFENVSNVMWKAKELENATDKYAYVRAFPNLQNVGISDRPEPRFLRILDDYGTLHLKKRYS